MRMQLFRAALMFVACVACQSAFSATLPVNCNAHQTITGAISRIAQFNPNGPNVIDVSGNCPENVVISNLGRLTISTTSTASISDPSSGAQPVISIYGSNNIAVTGLSTNPSALSISGEIACTDHSSCSVSYVAITNSADANTSAAADCVAVANASSVDLSGDTIQNCGGRGLVVSLASQAIVAGTTLAFNGVVVGDANIRLNDHAFLSLQNSTVAHSGFVGINVTDHSTVDIQDSTITANASGGVRVRAASEVSFTPNATGSAVTGNSGPGVQVFDVSFADFREPAILKADTVTGNTGNDISCVGHLSSAYLGQTVFGSSTCAAP